MGVDKATVLSKAHFTVAESRIDTRFITGKCPF